MSILLRGTITREQFDEFPRQAFKITPGDPFVLIVPGEDGQPVVKRGFHSK